MNAAARWCCGALVCFTLFLALGSIVAGRAQLAMDLEAAALWFGHGTEAAWWLTQSGYWFVLSALGLLALGAAFVVRGPVFGIILILVAQIVSQGAAAWFKTLFARPRPPHWLVHHDSGFSYPSGHAMTAVVFYGGLAALAAGTSLPPAVRRLVVTALVGWGIGIAWSRIALGAHYATDVIGGLLFGGTWFCLMRAFDSVRKPTALRVREP